MNEYRFWPLINKIVQSGDAESLKNFISLLTPDDIAKMRRDVERLQNERL